jgi:hypothetical protein
MGDRANVIFKESKESKGIYFYTHWGGHELPERVQTALARHERWDDGAYLARIVFCEMVKGAEDRETGFGISEGICDNEHLLILLDVEGQRVRFLHPKTQDPIHTWTFEEYGAAAKGEINAAWLTAWR